MQTEAVFENIGQRIQKEISQANHSIFLAVAWFTNKNLFNALVQKARDGCRVSLIISKNEINQNSSLNYEELNTNGSQVYWVGNSDTELMHNKFCVIDNSTIITGSYNWSYKAEHNFENIVVTNGDTTLAEQFIGEFHDIRKQYFPDETEPKEDFPLDKIIKRLEILKNHILLEDLQDIENTLKKLEKYQFNEDVNEIIQDIREEQFASAIRHIENFISRNRQLSTDPEVKGLKLEIKNLENQLNAFENEKIELEKTLAEFNHRHIIEVGDIILEILQLRKEKFKSEETKFKEAEEDEKQYREQVKTETDREHFELSEDKKTELKNKFRKATMLCHPDRVSEEFQKAAQDSFIKLKEAYDANDLKRISEILEELETGHSYKTKSETVTKKDVLKTEIAKLQRKVEHLKTEIQTIKKSDTYKQINAIEDWDEYFNQIKKQLKQELKELKAEVKDY